MHNIEWQYYQHLANIESHSIYKLFFKIESWRLKQFEQQLKTANKIIAISPADYTYLKNHYSNNTTHYIPAFHPNEQVQILEGKGHYALFHGDLSVKDNELAAIYLIEEVFSHLDFPLIIAGLSPSPTLKQLISNTSNITLKANLPFEQLHTLIQEAHINILISFHAAGMKLKLLNTLFNGRFCIVNTSMIPSQDFEEICLIEDNPSRLQVLIQSLLTKVFTIEDIRKRQQFLGQRYSNIAQGKILQQLF